MLLIHPPIAKPGEPPIGIARLAGSLKHHNLPVRTLDASIEGFHYLLDLPHAPKDTFSKRAVNHVKRNREGIRSWRAFHTISRYHLTVNELNRVLLLAGGHSPIQATFSNYSDASLSPVKSKDLLCSSEHPERNLFFPYFKARLLQVFSEEPYEIAGFSLNYLSQALTTFAMIGFLKKTFPRVKIVLGGGLVSSWMSRPGWKNPFSGLVDHWIKGPGEETLLAMHGVVSDRDAYCPDFSGFSPDHYFSPGFILPYNTGTGCYWGKCSFCPEAAEKNRYHPFPKEQVLGDLDRLARTMDPSIVHLLDNALSPSMMMALIERRPAFKWYGFARITPHLIDPDFLYGLKQSGCVMLQLGIESGSQAVLDTHKKGVTVELAGKALSAIKKAGIATYGYLLFGTPGETLLQARRTLDFTVAHAAFIDFLNIAIFNLPLFSQEAEGLDLSPFYDGDLSLYSDFKHPKGWDRREVRRFLDREFKTQKEIGAIIQRDPPFFNSSHAPLFFINPDKKKSGDHIAEKEGV